MKMRDFEFDGNSFAVEYDVDTDLFKFYVYFDDRDIYCYLCSVDNLDFTFKDAVKYFEKNISGLTHYRF